MDFPRQPGVFDKTLTSLKQSQNFLNQHAKLVNAIREPWNMSTYQVLGELEKARRRGFHALNLDIPNSLQYTLNSIDEFSVQLYTLS